MTYIILRIFQLLTLQNLKNIRQIRLNISKKICRQFIHLFYFYVENGGKKRIELLIGPNRLNIEKILIFKVQHHHFMSQQSSEK